VYFIDFVYGLLYIFSYWILHSHIHTPPIHILQYPEKKIGHIKSFFELEADDIEKNPIKFDEFKGKVTIITNVASYCGKYSL